MEIGDTVKILELEGASCELIHKKFKTFISKHSIYGVMNESVTFELEICKQCPYHDGICPFEEDRLISTRIVLIEKIKLWK